MVNAKQITLLEHIKNEPGLSYSDYDRRNETLFYASQVCKKMQKVGAVTIKKNKKRRAVEVYLTEKGERLIKKYREVEELIRQ